jgi:transcriptional/translational regulatory protein YebC/TACO1
LPLDEEEFELAVMETQAEDYEIEDGTARIITSRDDFIATVQQLETAERSIDESDLMFEADNTIALDTDGEEKLQKLIDALEEIDDVDTVWHNAG